MAGKVRKVTPKKGPRNKQVAQESTRVRNAEGDDTATNPGAKPDVAESVVEEPVSANFSERQSPQTSVVSATPDYSESPDVSRFPGFLDYIKPGNQFRWLWSFIEGWFLSRTYATLAVATPFIIVAVGGSAFLWWLRTAPKDAIVKKYEVAIDKATAEKDFEKAGLYLHALTALRPHDHVYAFRLAVHDAEYGDENRARSILAGLTANDGYLPARKWLVQQAQQEEPLIALTTDQLEGQLLSILKKV